MELLTLTILSISILLALYFVSYIYRKYRVSYSESEKKEEEAKKREIPRPKQNQRKTKAKKTLQPKKKPVVVQNDDSGTESYSLEEQLAKTIMEHHQFSQDSINTSAVNEKPKIPKLPTAQRSNSKNRKGVTSEGVFERDPDWENVTGRKHKKKLYPFTKVDKKFEFMLDAEGGIVELPFCEISFPPDSVLRPLRVSVELEKYEKFVDETEEKVFVTSAVHFTTDGDTKLRRQFTMKLNTVRRMGRGWDGNVCCQIETKEADDAWMTSGRTEYIFGKPIQIVSDSFASFRVVITRGQNGAISRDLNIAAYIAKPKLPNPSHHFIHLCIYDKSQQTQDKVDSNTQKFLLKMQPRTCNVPFGSDLQFKILPTQKFSPEKKDVFMRWTEACKAFVNVRFQIRLNRNERKDPNFEAEYRTMVFLNILKVSTTLKTTQEEYFHFYWISATFYPKRKGKRSKIKGQDNEKISEDDGFASGSEALENDLESSPVSQNANGFNFPLLKGTDTPQKREIVREISKKKQKRKPAKTKESKIGKIEVAGTPLATQTFQATKITTADPLPRPSGTRPNYQPAQVQSTVTKAVRTSKPYQQNSEGNEFKDATNQTKPLKMQSQNVQSPTTVPPKKGNPPQRTKGNSSNVEDGSVPLKENFGKIKSQEFGRKIDSTAQVSADVRNTSLMAVPQRRTYRYKSPNKKSSHVEQPKTTGSENTTKLQPAPNQGRSGTNMNQPHPDKKAGGDVKIAETPKQERNFSKQTGDGDRNKVMPSLVKVTQGQPAAKDYARKNFASTNKVTQEQTRPVKDVRRYQGLLLNKVTEGQPNVKENHPQNRPSGKVEQERPARHQTQPSSKVTQGQQVKETFPPPQPSKKGTRGQAQPILQSQGQTSGNVTNDRPHVVRNDVHNRLQPKIEDKHRQISDRTQRQPKYQERRREDKQIEPRQRYENRTKKTQENKIPNSPEKMNSFGPKTVKNNPSKPGLDKPTYQPRPQATLQQNGPVKAPHPNLKSVEKPHNMSQTQVPNGPTLDSPGDGTTTPKEKRQRNQRNRRREQPVEGRPDPSEVS